jgi:hypothetical protein
MSFIRKEQADLLEWNNLNRSESDLKEILYLKSLKKFAINSLHDKYLSHDLPSIDAHHREKIIATSITNNTEFFLNSIQFEICKELCAYYEKMEANLSKFSQILNVETKFAELLTSISNVEHSGKASALHSSYLSQQHHGNLFFRIGLFGKSLKFASLHNKYYMYKHKSYEMLSNIQQLMLNKLSHARWLNDGHPENDEEDHSKVINTVALLHHNQEPDLKVKECLDKCFIQVKKLVFFII